MSWDKVWLVLKREYWTNFKRPSFLFTAFGVPAISLIAMFLIISFTTGRETNLDDFQQIGYVDRAGVITEDAANPDGYQPVTDPALEAPDAADFDALESAAAAQLENGDLDAYFVIAEDYTLTGQVDLYAPKNIPLALSEDIEDFLRGQIAAQVPESVGVPVEVIADPMEEATIRDLDSDDELGEAGLIGRLMLPFIFVFLYFMATSTTAQFLMSGVVEEKENRLMEILATSLRPIELLWGKMLGLGALALTQVVIWSAAGMAITVFNEDAREFLTSTTFTVGDILLIMALFVINFLLFAAMMMGLGAAVTAEAESRQIAGVLTFIMVMPMALLATFFTNPNGPLPTFFTFFPFTAAMGLIMRMGMTTLPTWQIVTSIAIQVIFVIVVMWLAAKVFRLGMLMYGKPLTPRALWEALREGRVVMTTATTEGVAPVRKKKRGLLR